jgi:signal transduction histidine kinase
MVMMIQRDSNPSCIYWDIPSVDETPDVVIIYNEAYTHLIGQKHPDLQGTDPKYGFAEIWAQFADILENCRQSGTIVENKNAFLLLHRHGFLEETYFSWKFMPIIGPLGYVVGSYATVVEATTEVLAARRLSVVRHLSQTIASSRDYKDLWMQVLAGLEGNANDIPLALIYSVLDNDSKPPTPGSAFRPSHCYLEGSLGVERDHLVSPSLVDLCQEGTIWETVFRKAIEENSSYVVLKSEDGSLPANLLDGIKWRGFGLPPTSIVVCPIRSSTTSAVLSFLVTASNPRRPYDSDYQDWIELLTRSIATPHVEALLAAADSVQLSVQLKLRTRDLQESERKFLRFAKRSTVGILILNTKGDLLFGNGAWYDLVMMGNSTISSRQQYSSAIHPEDRPLCDGMWDYMIREKVPVNYQCRFLKPWKPNREHTDVVEESFTSILVSAWPDPDEDGNISTIMATATDISEIKFIEEQLRQKTGDAERRVKQQEAFVDMVSHEIRNPLSAILHCADEISTSLHRQISQVLPMFAPDNMHSMIQAADTISYCAMHQKRIVDDILTLSKLDSDLLEVSPQPEEPVDLVERALRMFDAELKRLDMQLHLVINKSVRELKIRWLLFDSSRLIQVLINLMTNAVKFTRDSHDRREITVTISASIEEPSHVNDDLTYVPSMNKKACVGTNWPPEDIVYLSISVQDTGRGITPMELKTLFHRFAQASPKTQVQ